GEHDFNVGDRLLDFAVDHAHEIQRLIKLDHHRIDQHEIADSLGARFYLESAHHHGGGKSAGEDDGLPRVEHGKRSVGVDTRIFVACHRTVVTGRFALLGRKILDRLIVEQRVDRLDVGVGIAVIHLASYFDPPLSGAIGIGHIDHDRYNDRCHVAPVELPHQHNGDKQQFYDRRRELQDHHADDGFDSVTPAFEYARQPAGLSLKMKSERQLVHVHKGAEGESTDGMHRHFGKQAVAQLREHRHQDSHAAVCDGHRD